MTRIEEAIRERVSTRDYSPEIINTEHYALINDLLNNPIATPFGNKPRFKLVEQSNEKGAEKAQIGTYGFIKGAKYFIIGAIEKAPYCEEDYGYAMEYIILKLTEIGYATCWLGGSIKRNSLADNLKMKATEIIPAITPMGYPAVKKRMLIKIQEKIMKPRVRKPWDTLFFDDDSSNPLSRDFDKNHKLALEMLQLAPSAINAQPWRVYVENQKNFHFYLNRKTTKELKAIKIDLQKVDIGIGMLHFEQTLKENGIKGAWQVLIDKGIERENLLYRATWMG